MSNNTRALHLSWVMLVCIAAPSTSRAAPQTITIKTETDFYTLTYDDQRISAAEIKEILYLSPYYPADVPSPYFMTFGAVKEGQKLVRIKWFVSIPLEQCNPGYTECAHQQLTPAFFTNAQENLDKTRNALLKLRSEKLPEVLEPVRAYLIRHLQETLSMEQARFNFLKTGSPMIWSTSNATYAIVRIGRQSFEASKTLHRTNWNGVGWSGTTKFWHAFESTTQAIPLRPGTRS